MLGKFLLWAKRFRTKRGLPSKKGDDSGGFANYATFISYRHVEPDRKWAKWLHGSLETYRLPKHFAQERSLPRRIGMVFRDEEELAASPHLSREIEEALRRSNHLIVVCSPRTPNSRWVNAEVDFFRKIGRGDKILALLIEGEPCSAFPASLLEIRPRTAASESAGLWDADQPLAADVRPDASGSARGRRQVAKLRYSLPFLAADSMTFGSGINSGMPAGFGIWPLLSLESS